jgi:HPt (histidine-containing phosphotransfer) domain-containing protein
MSPTCDPAAALERLGGDAALYGEAVAAFLADEMGTLARLGAAVAQGNAEEVHKAAHALKGHAGMCGATLVAETAAELESQGHRGELSTAAQAYARLETDLRQAAIELKAYCG